MANPTLTVKVNGDTSNLSTSLSSATTAISSFGKALPTTRIEALVQAGKKVVDWLHKTSQAGAAAVNAENAFALAMENMGVSMEENAGAINDAIEAAAQLGFTDDDTRKAIEYLTRGTGDLNTALGYLPGAMDLARSSGKDLITTADALGESLSLGADADGVQKVGMKLTNLLGGVGRGASDVATTLNDAGGAAATWAAEPANSAEIAKVKMDEMKETMSMGVTGAMKSVQDAIGPLIEAFGKLVEALQPGLSEALAFVGNLLGEIIGFFTTIVEGAANVIEWLGKIANSIQDVLDKNKEATEAQVALRKEHGGRGHVFGNSGGSASSGGGIERAGGGSGSTMGAPIINIYGDPAVIEAKVASAIRNYNRRNGPGAILSPGRT